MIGAFLARVMSATLEKKKEKNSSCSINGEKGEWHFRIADDRLLVGTRQDNECCLHIVT